MNDIQALERRVAQAKRALEEASEDLKSAKYDSFPFAIFVACFQGESIEFIKSFKITSFPRPGIDSGLPAAVAYSFEHLGELREVFYYAEEASAATTRKGALGRLAEESHRAIRREQRKIQERADAESAIDFHRKRLEIIDSMPDVE